MTSFLLLLLLVALPALAGLLLQPARPPLRPDIGIGAALIYRKEEVALHPVPAARDIQPAEHGEGYYYSIIRYLRVSEVLDDGRIVAVASDRQRLCFWPDDSSLRMARLSERLRYQLHQFGFPLRVADL